MGKSLTRHAEKGKAVLGILAGKGKITTDLTSSTPGTASPCFRQENALLWISLGGGKVLFH